MINTEFVLSLDALRAEIRGTIIRPEDAGYDVARQAWNLTVDQHPALILIAHNADDVALGIRYARAHNLGIAIQATGHGTIVPADDCLLIITSQLKAIALDIEAQTAYVEAGVQWKNVVEKTHAAGLMPLLGSSSNVGAIGYTLGGGMGWLTRKFGLAIDSVLKFDIVTPDGERRTASITENSDLFWALRGGAKGTLGVVTAMHIRLYPVASLYSGSIIYPIEDAKEVFTYYRDWYQHLSKDWTTAIGIMHMPPMPELPPFLQGRSVVMVTGAYCGDPKIGQMLVQPFMDWREPIVNTFHPTPLTEWDSISNEPVDPMPARSTGAWLNDLSDETIDRIVEYASSPTGAILKAEIRYAGGAIADMPSDLTAYDHRSSSLLLQCVGILPTPESAQQFESVWTSLKRDLGTHLSGGVYMNFLEGEEAHTETANAFTQETFSQLSELKAKYDPDNLFRYGYNIPIANN